MSSVSWIDIVIQYSVVFHLHCFPVVLSLTRHLSSPFTCRCYSVKLTPSRWLVLTRPLLSLVFVSLVIVNSCRSVAQAPS
ncbi:hypothetical protein Patl1_10495 [Pistacia atlantica]|uniref:Uncharacterized protein n=1 Tax=Pistacia atlantica TaxID=434234 RepID=A0ACC1A5K8_9ROSI|nr:hypothetical protein Patl1_10495 [Pistacia atlantica]